MTSAQIAIYMLVAVLAIEALVGILMVALLLAELGNLFAGLWIRLRISLDRTPPTGLEKLIRDRQEQLRR